jgi:NAD(P)-dependent dehydrogenase (short-subunit alcohol dehydrogenase family)
MPAFGFTTEDIPDLTGKIAIVTGGNTGIGFATCVELLRKGAKVYLAARSETRAKKAIGTLQKEIPGALVVWLPLDLMSLKSVMNAVNEFKKGEQRLDILINNAGIMACPFQLSEDGIESQFATNHVGHFLLTRELLPYLVESRGRIVNVSSMLYTWHPPGGIAFEDLNNASAMSNLTRYGQSKLANILFTRELHKRFGDHIYVNAVHPGIIRSELSRGMEDTIGKFAQLLLVPFAFFFTNFVQSSPEKGALNSLFCATSTNIEQQTIKNTYFVPNVQPEALSPIACDDDLSNKLWEFTERLIREKQSQI